MPIFTEYLRLDEVLQTTREQGYAWVPQAVQADVCEFLVRECKRLSLLSAERVQEVRNAGQATQVVQAHTRIVRRSSDHDAPLATSFGRLMTQAIRQHEDWLPQLGTWAPTHLSYQRYEPGQDGIGPHRDHRSDQLLGITLTLVGTAQVNIYASHSTPIDYRERTRTDSFMAVPGTLLCLRAQGLGSGERVIHEVMAPVGDARVVLNLRMQI